MCGPIAAMLIMVFFTPLLFLEETLSGPHPAGDYAFQCFFDEFTPQKSPNACPSAVNIRLKSTSAIRHIQRI